MGRKQKRKQVSSSQSSGTDTSLLSRPEATSTPTTSKKFKSSGPKENLARFAFQPRRTDDMEAKGNNCHSEEGDSPDNVFSPDQSLSVQNVTNADIMRKLCENGAAIAKLSQMVEEMKSEIFSLQTENDKLKTEVKQAREREEVLKSQLAEIKSTAELADRRSEEVSAYVRRSNLRIFGVSEGASDDREETAAECEQKVLRLFKDKLNVVVDPKDIDAVHRVGTRKKGDKAGNADSRKKPARGIIVRFVSRRMRDTVLYARKNLRGTKVFMVEDLTPRTYSLLCHVRDDTSVCKQAWTKNGKVMMKTVNGKIVQVDSMSDLHSSK